MADETDHGERTNPGALSPEIQAALEQAAERSAIVRELRAVVAAQEAQRPTVLYATTAVSRWDAARAGLAETVIETCRKPIGVPPYAALEVRTIGVLAILLVVVLIALACAGVEPETAYGWAVELRSGCTCVDEKVEP